VVKNYLKLKFYLHTNKLSHNNSGATQFDAIEFSKIEKFASKAQDIATKQMEKAQEIAVAELDLKRKRLEMAATARQEQVSATKADMKSKFVLECIQHIPMDNREAFIKEYLGKM